jgi:hypothetical protein
MHQQNQKMIVYLCETYKYVIKKKLRLNKNSKKIENPNKDTKENQNIIETNKIG